MGIMRKSDDPDQPGHALFVALPGAAPLVKPEAARSAVFAALGGLEQNPRWARVLARDRSVDGQFYYSVATTRALRLSLGSRAQARIDRPRIPGRLSGDTAVNDVRRACRPAPIERRSTFSRFESKGRITWSGGCSIRRV
jgi:hypothetical protein